MKKIRIGHIGIHEKANLNSGDTLLFQVVRDLYDYYFENNIHWNLYQIWEEFDGEVINSINKENDIIVLGGGGLLLKDQMGSDITNSGWQWNCSSEHVRKILKPLLIFAVGYNRFPNQEDFDSNFVESINAIAEKSPFLSLRNNGSIESVKRYIKKINISKCNIFRQFCPTTIVSYIYPEFKKIALDHATEQRKILSFNAAFDRTDMRFKDPEKAFNSICKLIKYAESSGWTIISCSHKEMDREIESYLRKNNVNFKIKDLTSSSPKEIMKHYASIDLSVGMRGHSQMIPFGFNKPIISLISHDKLKFFLDDLNLLKFGIDLNSNDLLERFSKILNHIETKKNFVIEELKLKQASIWSETNKNFSIIKNIINQSKKEY